MNLVKYIILILILSFSSCIKDVDYKLDFEGSKMVVFAGGGAGLTLGASITRTIPPLTKTDNPDSLIVNDALIEIINNSIVIDTMISQGKGNYISHIRLKENSAYKIKVKKQGWNEMESSYDTVPVPAKLIKVDIIDFSEEKDTSFSYDFSLLLKLQIKKSVHFPFNAISLNLFANGKVYDDYIFLSSNNKFVECDNCYNLLDNPCSKYLGNGIYEITTEKTVYVPEFKLNELDSIRFFLETYTSLSDKLCQSGIDFEEYYGNPLPFSSNPPADFSNIEGGYGLFLLNSVDSITVKL